ncbi:MAG: HAMP domain-containing histidine kinase [Clostridiales bacterium]|nr:HAMP domain-containing histidine kinase [Clostridiales bacterium]
MIKFFAILIVFIIAVVAFIIISSIIMRQFIWQEANALYRFFRWIDEHLFLTIILCGAAGFTVLFIYYWRKTLGFIDIVVEASEILAEREDGVIEMPNELKQIEIRMNQAKQDAVRNARLAKEAEQRKNDLIIYLAHDIKTPLTSIVGYLNLLDEARDMPPEQRAKYTGITLDKVYRLERLIDEFFEITRYNLQMIVLSKEKIDLCYMLVQLADEFYPLLSASGKSAAVRAPEDITVYGDPDKLARVFNNILKNAAAYGSDGSVIDITAGRLGNTVSVVIKNDGAIPQDKLASIFEKFYRLDSARSSGTGGSGLGLAIAKEIVTLHGGRIYAESDGAATAFTVELPASPGT